MYTHLELVEYEAKSRNANTAALETTDGKAYVTEKIPLIEARIDQICAADPDHPTTFAPEIATRYFDATPEDIIANDLVLEWPLLALTSLTVDGTAKTQWTGSGSRSGYDFMLPRDGAPYRRIIGLQAGTWTPSETYTNDVIAVTGTWGYRTNYPNEGWDNSGATGTVADTTTKTITVSSEAPFSPGMLIQIESEMMLVTTVTTNTLTVAERGARGSTAAAHDGAAVSIWKAQPDIERAATIWATFVYQRRGVFEAFRVETGGGFVAEFERDIPQEVQALLAPYMIRRIGVI